MTARHTSSAHEGLHANQKIVQFVHCIRLLNSAVPQPSACANSHAEAKAEAHLNHINTVSDPYAPIKPRTCMYTWATN